MMSTKRVTITTGTYAGCFGTINRTWPSRGLTEVYMPPQPTNDGRSIRYGCSWLFKSETVKDAA